MTVANIRGARTSEADWQATVVDLAQLRGWMVHHQRPARTRDGWRTAVAYDGAGFPDLVLARAGQVLFLELKTDTGRPTSRQLDWLRELGDHAHIIRPSDWDQLQELLT